MMRIDRSLIVQALTELADAAYQERIWAGRDPRVMSSLTECVEQLFDDSGLEHALERGTVFGPSVDEKLRVLGTRLSMVDATQPVTQLLHDKGLIQSQGLAADILHDLALDGSHSCE